MAFAASRHNNYFQTILWSSVYLLELEDAVESPSETIPAWAPEAQQVRIVARVTAVFLADAILIEINLKQ